MNQVVRRWVVGVSVAAAVAAGVESLRVPGVSFVLATRGAAAAAAQAPAEQLKTDAFEAIKAGQFGRSNELLARAAAIDPADPTLRRMAGWVAEFEGQREEFAAERRKQYDKAVADVHTLLDNGKQGYAIDAAARAYLLADDKKTFRGEPWVDDLIRKSAAMAASNDANEEWLKSLRLYSDLASVEPANPEWKNKLKLATRRIRLLALYAPEQLKALQAVEVKSRNEADKLIAPTTMETASLGGGLNGGTGGATTNPATAPATRPMAGLGIPVAPGEDVAADSFKIDWHETVRGANMDMLREALAHAEKDYYRPVKYHDLVLGGINGLRVVATTKGLDKPFPRLADDAARRRFVKALDDATAKVKGTDPGDEEQFLQRDGVLSDLLRANNGSIDLPEEVFASEFADGAFAVLDPFSTMIWPSEADEFFKATKGTFSGVGIQIQSAEDGGLQVVSPLEDSPAYKAGIKAGDVITRIDGKNAKGISLTQAVKSITGPSGTVVTLTIRTPAGKSTDYPIRRQTIDVKSVKGWRHRPGGGWDWFVDAGDKVAYVRITNFSENTTRELNAALDEMRDAGARAAVIDLRYNPGGLLQTATEVCDRFLAGGTIVSTHPDRETENAPTSTAANRDADDVTLPLVVLVNQYSASASEIVSGCLKDHNRATIVGERTFGKGSVQMLFGLGDRRGPRWEASLKLTTSHYYLPNGKCIHREETSTDWGVDPHLTIEVTPEQMRAAQEARQDLDVLRDADPAPAQGAADDLKADGQAVETAVRKAGDAKPKKDPLASDPQLSAGLLLLRMKLAGAPVIVTAGR